MRGSVAWWSDAKTRTYCCNSTIELLIAVDLQTRQSCVAKKLAVVEPAFFKLHCVPWSDGDASVKPAMWMWPLQTVSNQMEELRLPADANRMGRKASFEKHAPKKRWIKAFCGFNLQHLTQVLWLICSIWTPRSFFFHQLYFNTCRLQGLSSRLSPLRRLRRARKEDAARKALSPFLAEHLPKQHQSLHQFYQSQNPAPGGFKDRGSGDQYVTMFNTSRLTLLLWRKSATLSMSFLLLLMAHRISFSMPHIIGSLPLLEPHGAQKMVVTIQAPHLFRKTGKRGKRGKSKVPKVLFTLQTTSTTTATAITTLILKKTIIAPSDHGKFLDSVVICIYYVPHIILIRSIQPLLSVEVLLQAALTTMIQQLGIHLAQ